MNGVLIRARLRSVGNLFSDTHIVVLVLLGKESLNLQAWWRAKNICHACHMTKNDYIQVPNPLARLPRRDTSNFWSHATKDDHEKSFLIGFFLVGTIFNCSMFVVINLSPHEPAIWGALIRLCSFDISQVCFCSMHALNLGFALWAAGSTLKLMVEFYHLWGGPECDLRSRYKSAWLHFSGWTTERKIPRLCAIDQVFDSVHSSHCMVNIFKCGFYFTLD